MQRVNTAKNTELDIEDIENLDDLEYIQYIENALDEADRQAEDPNTKYLTMEEVFESIRREYNL